MKSDNTNIRMSEVERGMEIFHPRLYKRILAKNQIKNHGNR